MIFFKKLNNKYVNFMPNNVLMIDNSKSKIDMLYLVKLLFYLFFSNPINKIGNKSFMGFLDAV